MNHEVHHYLPVTDRARSRALASDHELMASYSKIYDPESGEVK